MKRAGKGWGGGLGWLGWLGMVGVVGGWAVEYLPWLPRSGAIAHIWVASLRVGALLLLPPPDPEEWF